MNVGLLLALVPPLGIEGAAIALCGAYVAMLVVLHLLTRRLFAVPFETARIAALVLVVGGMAVAGNLLLPTSGAAGLLSRLAVWLAIGPALVAARVVSRAELRAIAASARELRGRAQSRRPPTL